MAQEFRMMVENPSKSIEGLLKPNANEYQKENFVLKSIISCIMFLGNRAWLSEPMMNHLNR